MNKSNGVGILFTCLISLATSAQDAPFFSETIYDTDDRLNVSELQNPTLAAAVVVAISHRYARLNPLITPPTLEARYRTCRDVAFAQEPSIGDCTGVHVGGGIVLTAQHCVKNNYDCEKLSWAFDYTLDSLSGSTLGFTNLYQCEAIVAQDEALDVTLIKLKQAPRLPKQKIDLRLGGAEQVFAIGSPLGLPLKHSGVGPAVAESSTHLRAAIDVFQGSSGSPIFNLNEQMIGLLVSGGRDFESDPSGCRRNFVTRAEDPQERVVLLRALPENMKKIIQRAQRSR